MQDLKEKYYEEKNERSWQDAGTTTKLVLIIAAIFTIASLFVK
jgi:hypothetical protein